MSFKIVDSHVHFEIEGYDITSISKDYIAKYGEEKLKKLQLKNKYQSEKWQKAWGFPKAEPALADVKITASLWIEELNKNNIDKMVFATGGGNEKLSEIVKLYPDRFIGYAHHNPFDTDSAQKLEYAVTNLGLKGYKILAPALQGKIDDEVLNPLWEVAEKHQLPVLIHFGILGGAGGIAKHHNISPMILHDVARAYPDISFIIPHFGCGQPQDLLQLA
ncbi:MAG: 2-amino-3-carboxymuconate-6-semialdehyde decarboxylase [Clostridiales bacterium]|nr:2-amino-3-carboxymuconate-6-semialdehyde decarboxylase [Clostridiales bacterium]